MQKFLLAVERNNNDYVPIDWTQSCVTEELEQTNIKKIDYYTSMFSKEELVEQLLDETLLDEEYYTKPIVIIYERNNRYRKLPEGPMYKENLRVASEYFIANFILNNINDRQLLNKIYNYFNGKDISEELRTIINCLNRSNDYTTLELVEEITHVVELSYMERRMIGFYIQNELIPSLDQENNIVLQMKEDNHD